MRNARIKADPEAKEGFYHCYSRVVDRQRLFMDAEREHFVKLMRAYETFGGLQVMTFCILLNHFHILVKVPRRPADKDLPTDTQLVELVKGIDGTYSHEQLEMELKSYRQSGNHTAAEALRECFFARMWNISPFFKTLKQRFSQNQERGGPGD